MVRIKDILKEKGLTVQGLADFLGISRQALSRQLQGRMLVETAERIAKALGVPLWELFASPDDVAEEVGKRRLTCPHCGKEIHITLS